MSRCYSLLMQKSKSGSEVKDLLKDFGMVCTDVPFLMCPEIKDLPSNNWSDEHGEDVYIPEVLMVEAYDWEIGVCYKGDKGMAESSVRKLLEYLTGLDGSGAEMKLYNSHVGIGRKGYFKGSSGYSLSRSAGGDIAEFKIKFRVTDPITEIILS